MKVTTESGTVYVLENGWWRRNDSERNPIWKNYSVPNSVKTWDDVHDCKRLPLTVGLRMFIEGREEWALSTRIVSIEGERL